jgi:hypothetical protein
VGHVLRSKNLLVQEPRAPMFQVTHVDIRFVCVTVVCVCVYVLDERKEHTGNRQRTAEGHRGDTVGDRDVGYRDTDTTFLAPFHHVMRTCTH